MSKTISAIIVVATILIAGCAIQPAVSLTPAPELKAWDKQIQNSVLAEETIVQDESLARVVYTPEGAKGNKDALLVGYLPDDSRTVLTLKELCEEYVKAAYTADYNTIKGDEEWYLYSSGLIKQSVSDGAQEASKKYVTDNQIVSTGVGVEDYKEFLITTGGIAGISFEATIRSTGAKAYLDTLKLNNDGTQTIPLTIIFVREEGSWKIDSIINELWDRVELKKVE